MQRVEIPGRPVASLETSSKSKKKMVEFRITHPDKTMYSLTLPSNCTGQDCLNELCEILGIVEKDYFGLQYVDKNINCNIWINKRLRLKRQLKIKPPYNLLFVVKFFTDVELLLQPSTIEAFYKDLKFQIHHGLTRVPDSKKAMIGATIAQADFGDTKEHNSTTTTGHTTAGGLVYPDYFPNWSSGDGHLIEKEHKKLKGVSKTDAQSLMLTTVYQVDGFGMQYYPAVLNNEVVVLGVGARYVAVYDTQLSIKKRVTFYNITQVSFGYKFFAFSYLTREEGTGVPVTKKIVFHVPNHAISRSLFRSVTEAQVFLHQTTVSPSVFNHSDHRNARVKRFCQKVFKMEFETHYYYDIHYTKNEAYRHYWQLLNQVQDESSLIYEPSPTSLAYINLSAVRTEENSNEEVDETSSQNHNKTALIWGLSMSSSNLAKQLLPEAKLQLSESESIMTYTPSPPLVVASDRGVGSSRSDETNNGQGSSRKTDLSETEESTLEPLTGAQSKAFQQLLLKIQDERLCNVCMDELISSVFCPCGHYVACDGCAKKLDKCPVCRHPVAYVQSVYTKYL